MSDVVLWLNLSKCMVSTLAREVPAGMEDGWEQAARHDRLFITGRPYSVDNATLGHSGRCSQWETKRFRADFCEQHERQDRSGIGADGAIHSACRGGTASKTVRKRLAPTHCLRQCASSHHPSLKTWFTQWTHHVSRSIARISYFTQDELNARNEQIPLSLTEEWACKH